MLNELIISVIREVEAAKVTALWMTDYNAS